MSRERARRREERERLAAAAQLDRERRATKAARRREREVALRARLPRRTRWRRQQGLLARRRRTENGVITTNAAGRSVVTLGYKYAAAKTIQLTPKGTASRSAVYDNIILSQSGANTFDVYLFNSAFAQISGEVAWVFQGV